MTKQDDLTARDAYLDLVRAYERLSGEFAALFREHDLTQAQYNVLRILLGGPTEGASCQYVGERLLTRVPDVTRLIDRMAAAGLVTRSRSAEDRRVVLIQVTEAGKTLCRKLARPVMNLHRDQFAHMAKGTVAGLSRALRQIVQPA